MKTFDVIVFFSWIASSPSAPGNGRKSFLLFYFIFFSKKIIHCQVPSDSFAPILTQSGLRWVMPCFFFAERPAAQRSKRSARRRRLLTFASVRIPSVRDRRKFSVDNKLPFRFHPFRSPSPATRPQQNRIQYTCTNESYEINIIAVY